MTGQQTSLTTFTGSTLDSATAATTLWNFDPATGRLLSKSYQGTASGDSDIAYGYGTDNKDALLHTITRPGSVETLSYNDGSNSTPDTGDVSTVAFQDNGTAESIYNYTPTISGPRPRKPGCCPMTARKPESTPSPTTATTTWPGRRSRMAAGMSSRSMRIPIRVHVRCGGLRAHAAGTVMRAGRGDGRVRFGSGCPGERRWFWPNR
ncbi:MAG: hypothetical protein ABSH20_10335 [Tepidisphaeraceae bacterium]